MRLRRLANRLRNYDWTSGFIELLIVLLGILIALRVNNWNEDRQNAARANAYLQRIHTDLLSDIHNIDVRARFWKQVSVYGNTAIDHAEHGTLRNGSAWQTLLAYYQASQLLPYTVNDTTFLEMRDSGDMSLIQNQALRSTLSFYYTQSSASAAPQIFRLVPEYRAKIRGLTPWQVQPYIWAHCFHAVNDTEQQLIDCPAPISEAEAQAALDQFGKSPELPSQLRYWMSTLTIGQILLGNSKADADRLAMRVRAEIGK